MWRQKNWFSKCHKIITDFFLILVASGGLYYCIFQFTSNKWNNQSYSLCSELAGCTLLYCCKNMQRYLWLRILSFNMFSDSNWKVTPLLGDFGGRAGFSFSLQSPPIPLSFVVESCTLFSVFMRVNACLQACGTRDCIGQVKILNQKPCVLIIKKKPS